MSRIVDHLMYIICAQYAPFIESLGVTYGNILCIYFYVMKEFVVALYFVFYLLKLCMII